MPSDLYSCKLITQPVEVLNKPPVGLVVVLCNKVRFGNKKIDMKFTSKRCFIS